VLNGEQECQPSTARLTDQVNLLQPQRLDEIVNVLDLTGNREIVEILRIVGHARAQLVGRQHAEALCEPAEDRGPQVGVGRVAPFGRTASTVNQHQRLAGAFVVIACAHALHINELRLEAIDGGAFRDVRGRGALGMGCTGETEEQDTDRKA
jgi:hypothetical protein